MLSGNAEIIKVELKNPIHSLWLKVNMKEEQGALIFLLNPCNRLCGSIMFGMSNFIKEIYISDTVCTMNGLRHALMEGSYSIVILPYSKETNTNLSIQIQTNIIKTYQEKFCQKCSDEKLITFDNIIETTHQYYKGDFHGHTIFSDGHQTIQEAKKVLEKNDMDFMAFTEHNSMPFDLPKLSCMSIPSFELTLPIGHMNIHGVADLGVLLKEIQKISNYEELWEYVIRKFKEECNLSLNHMFMEPWHLTYKNFDLSKINTIEVICDPTYPSAAKANDKAVCFLDFLWQEGLIIYGIGGSDSHNREDELYENASEASVYGDPATYVYCEGLSVRNVVEGVRKGHCYVSRYGKLVISISEGKYLPGDQISEETEITYQIHLENMQVPCIGRFIMNGETVWEDTLDDRNSEASYQFTPSGKPWWLRFGLYDKSGHVIAYVNPIYNRTNMCQNAEFKNLYDKFGEKYDQRNTI
jgi:hypothetical protein